MADDDLNPPLGTTTPEIFLENVERADRLVNGPPATIPDRGGKPLDTWRQMMAKNDEIRRNIIPLDKQRKDLAEAQADIANIPPGSYTYVRSPDGSALAIEYMNVDGTLTATGRVMLSQFSVLSQAQVMGEFDANEGQFRRAAEGELIFSGHIHEWRDFRTLNQIGFHVPSFTNSGPSSVETTIKIFADGALVSTLYLPRLSARYDNGTLFCPYAAFKLSDCTLHRIAARDENVVRIQFVIPTAKLVQVESSGVAFYDLSGKFRPVPTISEAETATAGNIVAKTAALNIFQFVVNSADITAAGYDYTSDGHVEAFVRRFAATCQFIGYTSVYKNLVGLDGYFSRLIPPGNISIGVDSSGDQVATLAVFRKREPVQQPVGIEVYKSLSVENDSEYTFTDFPVEGKIKFNQGTVLPGSVLVLRDESGNEIPAQFGSEWHPNPRHRSDMGYYSDGSLASGSIFFNDTITPGQAKTYDLLAYARPRVDSDAPVITRNQNGLFVTVGDYTFGFTTNGGLGSITPVGESAISVQLQLWASGVVGSAITDGSSNVQYTQNVICSGPVFVEVEQVCYSRAIGSLDAFAVRHIVRYKLFKNGRAYVRIVNQATRDIPVSTLAGAYHVLALPAVALTFDEANLFSGHATRANGKIMTVTLLRSHGDLHRDGEAYGPTRSGNFQALNPTGTSTRLTGGWKFTSATATSFTTYPVSQDYCWTGEFYIDLESDQSTTLDTLTALYNRPVGYFGNPEWPGAKREKLFSRFDAYCRGSLDWFNSAAATPYDGGPSNTKKYQCYSWEIWRYLTQNVGSLDDIYTRFVAGCNANWGGFTTMGNGYLTGKLPLQFSSRLVIPVYEWLYKAAVREGNTTVRDGLAASMSNYAQAIRTKFNSLGGIPLDGSKTDVGNSNSNATAARILALAIYMGQDSGGTLRATFDAINTLLSGTGYNKVKGIWTDGLNNTLVRTNWFAYQVYAINNYLLACDLIDVEPALDLTTYMLHAQTGLGGYQEIFYCISESRRGQFNTATFAMYPLLRRGSASTVCSAEALWGEVERQHGAKIGLSRRMYQFQSDTAGGDSRYEVVFNVTVLTDCMMKFWFEYQQ